MRKSISVLSAALFAAAFIVLTLAVVVLGELPGERAFIVAVLDARSPGWTAPIQVITFLTSATPALVVCALCALLELRRLGRTPRALWPLVVYFGYLFCNVGLRILIGRMRPDVEYIPNLLPEISASFQQFSYPSGHAGSAVVAWGCLSIVAWRARTRTRVRALVRASALLVAVLLIGGTAIGRVYLGVHWPSDVLGGLLLSSAWLTFGNSITLPRDNFSARSISHQEISIEG